MAKRKGKAKIAKATQPTLAEQSDARFRAIQPDAHSSERALAKRNAHVQRAFGHKVNATPQTAFHAAEVSRRAGTLFRLFQTEAIDRDQLAAGFQIAEEHARIGADVAVRGASLETRVDQTRMGHEHFFEGLGRVRSAMAYTRWREDVGQKLGVPAAMVLAIVAEDMGLGAAARRWRMSLRRARRLLAAALDLWEVEWGEMCRSVKREDVDEAWARLA